MIQLQRFMPGALAEILRKAPLTEGKVAFAWRSSVGPALDRGTSVTLQDEVNQRFKISADPIAVYSKDLAGAREIWDEFKKHPEKYPTVDQVVSVYSFEPPHDTAVANQMKEIEDRYWDARVNDLDGISIDYDDWHFNVRPSNTEPLLRLNLEARSQELMEQRRDELLELIRSP